MMNFFGLLILISSGFAADSCPKIKMDIDVQKLMNDQESSYYAKVLYRMLQDKKLIDEHRNASIDIDQLSLADIETLTLAQHLEKYLPLQSEQQSGMDYYLGMLQDVNSSTSAPSCFDKSKLDYKSKFFVEKKTSQEKIRQSEFNAAMLAYLNCQNPDRGECWKLVLSQIQSVNAKLKYSKNDPNIFHFTEEGVLNCYSGTAFFQLAELRREQKNPNLHSERVVLSVHGDHHVLSGMVDRKGNFSSIEHTSSAGSYQEGVMGSVDKPMKMYLAKDDLAFHALERYFTQSTRLNASTFIDGLLCRSQSELNQVAGHKKHSSKWVQRCSLLADSVVKKNSIQNNLQDEQGDTNSSVVLNQSLLGWGTKSGEEAIAEVNEDEEDLSSLNIGIRGTEKKSSGKRYKRFLIPGSSKDEPVIKKSKEPQDMYEALNDFVSKVRSLKEKELVYPSDLEKSASYLLPVTYSRIESYVIRGNSKQALVGARQGYVAFDDSITLDEKKGIVEEFYHSEELMKYVYSNPASEAYLFKDRSGVMSVRHFLKYDGDAKTSVVLPLKSLKAVLENQDFYHLWDTRAFVNSEEGYNFSAEEEKNFKKIIDQTTSGLSEDSVKRVQQIRDRKAKALKNLGFEFHFEGVAPVKQALENTLDQISFDYWLKSYKELYMRGIRNIYCVDDLAGFYEKHLELAHSSNVFVATTNLSGGGCTLKADYPSQWLSNSGGGRTREWKKMEPDEIVARRSNFLLLKKTYEHAVGELLGSQVEFNIRGSEESLFIHPNTNCPNSSCDRYPVLFHLYEFLGSLTGAERDSIIKQIKDNSGPGKVVFEYDSSIPQYNGDHGYTEVTDPLFVQQLDAFGAISFIRVGNLNDYLYRSMPGYDKFIKVKFNGDKNPDHVWLGGEKGEYVKPQRRLH